MSFLEGFDKRRQERFEKKLDHPIEKYMWKATDDKGSFKERKKLYGRGMNALGNWKRQFMDEGILVREYDLDKKGK